MAQRADVVAITLGPAVGSAEALEEPTPDRLSASVRAMPVNYCPTGSTIFFALVYRHDRCRALDKLEHRQLCRRQQKAHLFICYWRSHKLESSNSHKQAPAHGRAKKLPCLNGAPC